MTLRLSRPTPVLVALGALLVLGAGGAYALHQPDQTDQFVVGAVTLAAFAAVLVLPIVDPAVPIVAGLLLSIFSGWWDQLGIPLGLDRPLLVYGVVAAVLSTLPDARVRRRIEITAVHWLLLAVALYGIGSAVFAGTIDAKEPLFALSDRLAIMGFLLFTIAPVAFASRRSRDLLAAGLIVLGAYLALTAVFEQTGLRSLVFPRYINNPGLGIHFDRARGPFLEAGADGMAMYVCFVGCAIGYARWRIRWVRVACVAIGALCLVGILLTLTRQVWVGAALATLVALGCTARLRRLLVPAVVLGVVGVLGALTLIPGLNESASSRSQDRGPVWDRLNSDRAAIDMIEAKPLLGFGWYRFGPDSGPYLTQAKTYPLSTVPRPHNVFLANAAELGLIGASLWLVALLTVVGTAVVLRAPPEIEPWRIGLLAVAINWVVVANFSPLGYALPNLLLWFWAGVVWTGVRERATRRRTAPAGAALAPA